MKVIKNLLSFILSFLLVILIIFTIYVFNVRDFSNKDKMVKSAKEIDFSLQLKKLRNSGSVSGESKIINIINDIYGIAEEFEVSSDEMDKLINSKITKEIVGISFGNITDYVVNGRENKVLSADDIYKIIDDNIDDVLKSNNIKISEGQREKLLNRIKLELPDLEEIIPNVDEIVSDKYESMSILFKNIFSEGFSTLLIILDLIFGLILLIVNRKKGILYIGFSGLFASLLAVGGALIFPNILVGSIRNMAVSLLVSPFASIFSKYVINSCLIIIIISIILLVIGQRICKKG